MTRSGYGSGAELQRDFYRSLFQEAHDPQILIAGDGTVHEANQSCLDLLDAESREEVVGVHFLAFLAPWERDRAVNRFEAALEGAPRLNTFTIRTLRGQHRIVETIGTPLNGPEGPVLFLVLRDVTDRERAARARDLMGAIATAANQARTDAELGDAAVLAAQRVLGARVAAVCAVRDPGDRLEFIGAVGVGPDVRSAAEEGEFFEEGSLAEEVLDTGDLVVVERLEDRERLPTTIRHLVEEQHLGAAIAAPGILGGRILAVLIVAKGENEPFQPGDEELVQQAAEQVALWLERHRLLARLQRLNRARAGALRQMEAQRSELEAFTYTVSHDLKEPLRAVEVFTKILVDDYAEDMPEEAADIARRASNNAVRLRGMLDDILRLSRATTPTGKLTTVDVEQVVEDVASDLAVRLQERRAHLRVDHPLPPVRADPTRVREVFANLIGNAVKFNDKPEPAIEVNAEPAGEHFVEFQVSDNGPGIPPEEYERVFELFHRGSAGEAAPGTGAGLAIVKRILASYGGDIWITPRRGGGTVFHFTLPEGELPEGDGVDDGE